MFIEPAGTRRWSLINDILCEYIIFKNVKKKKFKKKLLCSFVVLRFVLKYEILNLW